MSVLGSELGKVSAQFSGNSDKMQAANAKADVYNKQIEVQKQKIDTLKTALANSAKEFGENSNKTKDWQIKLNNAEKELSNTENSLKKTTEEAKKTSGVDFSKLQKGLSDSENDAKKLSKVDFDKLGEGLKRAGNIAAGLAKSVAVVGTAIGGAVVTVGVASFNAASELEATEAKYNTVFGEFSKKSDEFITDFQKLTPATKAEARSMAAGVQDLLVPMGFARDKATEMTGETLNLIGALTNFNSATETAESVQTKFSAALTGEYSSLKSLGVQINANIVSEKAVAMGLANSTKEVSAQAKAQATLALITEQSGDALAAYNEESLDTKTRMELMKKSFTDTAAEIGVGLLPMVNDMMKAFKSLVDEILPPFKEVFGGIIDIFKGVEGGGDKLVEGMTKIVDILVPALTKLIPVIVKVVIDLVDAVLKSLAKNAPQIVEAGIAALMNFVNGLLDMLPLLIDTALKIIVELAKGIAQALPTLIPKIVDVVIQIVKTLIDNIDLLIDGAIQLVLGLTKGIIDAIPLLVEALPLLVQGIVDGIVNNLDPLIDAAIDIVIFLVEALINNYPKMLEASFKIIAALGEGLLKAVGKLWTVIPKLFKEIMELFKRIDWGEIGMQIINGIVSGFLNAGKAIKDGVKGAGDAIVGGFKSFFGIKSPSKLFEKEVGNNLALGIGQGFKKQMKGVAATMTAAVPTSFDTSVNALASGSRNTSGSAIYNINLPVYLDGVLQKTVNFTVDLANAQQGRLTALGVV